MSNWKEEIASHHHQFEAGPLNESDVDKDPVMQFEKWFGTAMEQKVPEQNSFTLCTATRNGVPSARIVLLKGVDPKGFIFFTNYESRKGKELEENPVASMNFYWPSLHRQIRIEGIVEKVTEKESKEYFHSRPKASQAGAWVSPQSRPIASREELDKQHAEFLKKHESIEIPAPGHWGGYRIAPRHFEFWQGRENRLHDRIAYTWENGKWKIYRMAP